MIYMMVLGDPCVKVKQHPLKGRNLDAQIEKPWPRMMFSRISSQIPHFLAEDIE